MNRNTIGTLILFISITCLVILAHDSSSPMAGYFYLLWTVTLAIVIPFFVRHVIQVNKRTHSR